MGLVTPFSLAVSMAYGLPSLALYVRTICVVFRNKEKKFDSSFYRIVRISGINDCLLYVLFNVLFRFPNMSELGQYYYALFREPSKFLGFMWFLLYYVSDASFYGSFLLSLNRMVVLFDLDRVWTSCHAVVVAFFYVCPLFTSFFKIVADGRVVYSNSTDSYATLVDVSIPAFKSLDDQILLIDVVLAIAFTLVCLVINLVTLGTLLLKRPKVVPANLQQHNFVSMANQQQPHNQKSLMTPAESRLLAISMAIFVVHLLSSLFQIVSWLNQSYTSAFALFYIYVSDLVSLAPGWLLIFGSQSLRHAALGKLRWRIRLELVWAKNFKFRWRIRLEQIPTSIAPQPLGQHQQPARSTSNFPSNPHSNPNMRRVNVGGSANA